MSRPRGKKRESKEIKSVLSDFKSGKEDAESQPIKACTEEEASPPVSVINNNNNIKKWKERNLCVRVLCIDPVFGRAGKVNEIRANIESRNFRALLVCAAFRRREGKATEEENWKKI